MIEVLLHSASQTVSRGLLSQMLPFHGTAAFVEVLRDLGVEVVACFGEADTVVAAVANHFHAPVLSNDSDFYVFNLVAGFCPLDYVSIKAKADESGQKFIDCEVRAAVLYASLLALVGDWSCTSSQMAFVVRSKKFSRTERTRSLYSLGALPVQYKHIPNLLGAS